MKVEQNFKQTNIKQIQPKYIDNKGFTQKQNQYKNTNPNFTGGADLFLRFLDTNQAWGANAVDLFCMVLPRTLTDFSRGVDAGTETLRREGMGTANHSMVGAYGTLAGLALASGINGMYKLGENDIKANSIFTDAETMDMQGAIWNNKLRDSLKNPDVNPIKEYLTETFKKYEALSPTENGKWIKIKDADIEKTVNILENEIINNSPKMSKEGFANARTILVSSLGAENNLRIIAEEGKPAHTSRYTVDSIIENTYKLGKVFTKEKVKEAFLAAENISENAFLKAMKSMNVKRSLLGIGIASVAGVSAQPLNMYLTKKKTGRSDFVGGGAEDKSTGFKIKKSLVAALFGAGVLATIGKPKELIKNLQFKGFTPTIKQFKFIYGVTIMSRFLSSRNDNELRECTIKDTLGFASWLILGNFVQKLVAQSMDKSLIKKDGSGAMNWIKNSVLKSRDEVLHAALGDKVFKDGKALSFNEMVNSLPKNSIARKQLKILSIAQLAGYAYSALALGAGIPKLNIFITNKVMSAQKNKTQNISTTENNATQNPAFNAQQQVDNMLKPENVAFLNNNQKHFTGTFGK